MTLINKITACIDLVLSLILTVSFLLAAAAALVVSKIGRHRRKIIKEIRELYLSIVDVRESVVSTQKEDMLLNGFKQKVFCYHLEFEKTRDESSDFGPDIHVTVLSVHPDNVFVRIGFRKSAACLVEVKALCEMSLAASAYNVNIIRAQDAHLLGFNAYLLSRVFDLPFIVQICSNYEIKDRQARGLTFRPFILKGIERRFERAVMKASDLVLTDRNHYRDFGLIPREIPEARYGNMGFFVSSVHYAPPSSRKDLRGELNISEEKKVLLYAGRLSEVKYPLDLIRMFAICVRKRRDLVFLVAGDGALRNDMERLAREGGFSENVIFLRKLPQAKLVDLYNTADVICFTSAGFTMVEAALAERCIVAYDFEWHAEFIGRNERGILVPFGDTGLFAQEVLMVLEDSKLRRRLGEEARAYAIANYSRDSAMAKEIGFYKRVLERRGYAFEKAV